MASIGEPVVDGSKSCRNERVTSTIILGLISPEVGSRFDHNVSNSVADIENVLHIGEKLMFLYISLLFILFEV